MSIWSDALLNQLSEDAAANVNKQLNCLYHRFYLATTAGTSVYTLPDKVRSIIRITWQGKKVNPLGWEELIAITPGTVYVDGSTNIETSQSTPQWYALHPTNIHDIRFYPTPDLSLSASGGDPYSPLVEDRCIISCWRHIDTSDSSSSLPTYIDRRTRKAFVLWMAFSKEGKGQDLKAAAYYKRKYEFLVNQFKRINEGCYVSKRYALADNSNLDIGRYPKPILPSNYERIIY